MVLDPLNIKDTAYDQVIADRKGLNYFLTDLKMLDNVYPNQGMKVLFWEHMEFTVYYSGP